MAMMGEAIKSSPTRPSVSFDERFAKCLEAVGETLNRMEQQLAYLNGPIPQQPGAEKLKNSTSSLRDRMEKNIISLEAFVEDFSSAVNRLEQF